MKIPSVGFGTWQLQGSECEHSVSTALEVGYRHIDTAERYENHKEVGRAIKSSNIARDKLFITSKVWKDSLHTMEVMDECQRALEELQLEYLDLYLIHWPNQWVRLTETIDGLNRLQEKGLIKGYGASNFTIHHLQDALDAKAKIVNNQVEFHPSLNQKELKKFCDEHKIRLTAYSPIAQGEDLGIPLVQELSRKYSQSPSQIILSWLLSKNIVVIPRSSKKERIIDNLGALKLKMEESDLEKMEELNTNNRLINPEWSEFNY